MRRSKKLPGKDAAPRLMIGISGIGLILGVHRSTVYRRINRKQFSLDGVPFHEGRHGTVYDLEGVFKRIFPNADANGIAGMMFEFMQKNGRHII